MRWRSWLIVIPFIGGLAISAQQTNSDGWRLAVPDDSAWRWEFPELFAPQPGFRTEWWYVTGHLRSDQDEWFGYQLTLFRIGMRPMSPPRADAGTLPAATSAWRFTSLWMGHFAITDIQRKGYHHSQRLVRGANNLAGYLNSAGHRKVYLGDWTLQQEPSSNDSASQQQDLKAESAGWSLQLQMDPGPVVLQGTNGLSQKAAGPGRASYYYSHPRMKTSGLLQRPGTKPTPVTGLSWFDREIGSNQLAPNQQGWDWFAIQLDSGASLMLYRMRLADETIDPHSHGKWIPPIPASETNDIISGTTIHPSASTLKHDAFAILPGNTWKSPKTGGVYPIEWKIHLHALNLELHLQATLPEQEFVSSNEPFLAYWEGSHRVQGTLNGQPIKGRAYVELTGYAGRIPGL